MYPLDKCPLAPSGKCRRIQHLGGRIPNVACNDDVGAPDLILDACPDLTVVKENDRGGRMSEYAQPNKCTAACSPRTMEATPEAWWDPQQSRPDVSYKHKDRPRNQPVQATPQWSEVVTRPLHDRPAADRSTPWNPDWSVLDPLNSCSPENILI